MLVSVQLDCINACLGEKGTAGCWTLNFSSQSLPEVTAHCIRTSTTHDSHRDASGQIAFHGNKDSGKVNERHYVPIFSVHHHLGRGRYFGVCFFFLSFFSFFSFCVPP